MASHQEKTFNNIPNDDEEQQKSHETITISPQEAEPYRAAAQQNSIDAIRAAEERYAKAKESSAVAFQHTKDTVVHGLGAGTNYVAGKGYQAADYTAEKGTQGYELAKEAAISAAQKTAELAKQAAVKAKDVTVSAGETAWNYATGKTGEAKEAPLGAERGTEVTGEKTVETGQAKEKLGELTGRGANISEEGM